MAYYPKYRFTFESQNGQEFRIDISQDGYRGTTYTRALGQSPVLRREMSDCVCGSSLNIYAECRVDGEFAELYTSDAREFRVSLYHGNIMIWQGFVSPELYSEPDIAPPYDVEIIATDGLGELKSAPYQKAGLVTLRSLLGTLLANTGLVLDVNLISSLAADTPAVVSKTNLLDGIKVDMDHMEGQSCYDVLQAVLSGLHATIMYYDGTWVLVRETDLSLSSSGVKAYTAARGTIYYPVATIGSINQSEWYPVGHLTNDVEPAKKGFSVFADNHYKKSVLVNSGMTSDTGWSKAGGATYSEGLYRLPSAGASISQSYSFASNVGYPLVLRIKARNVGNGTTTAKLGVKVKIAGTSYSGSGSYYLSDFATSSRRRGEGYGWGTVNTPVEVELQAPATSDTDTSAMVLDLVLPLHRNSARDYTYATSIEVTLSNVAGTYPQYIYECSLVKYEQSQGYKADLLLSNDARETLGDVMLGFSRVASDNNYAGLHTFQHAVLCNSSDNEVLTLSTDALSAMDYMSLMVRDYALSYALPRLVKRGTLNVPAGERMPMAFLDQNGISYFVRTFDWTISSDDVSVELVSLPAATISVAEEGVEKIENPAPSVNGGGSIASGGGGSAPYVLPKATEASLGGVAVGYFPQGANLTVEIDTYGNIYVPLTDSAITAALGYKPGKSDGGGGGDYTLPVATSSALGGIKIGYTATGANRPVQLSNQKAYVQITKSAIVQALGYTPADEQDIPGPSPDPVAQEAIDRTAPRLRITRGEAYNGRDFDTLEIDHPNMTKAGAELVLMVYNRRTGARRKRGTNDYYRRSSKKWGVAMGEEADRLLVLTGGMNLQNVRDYILHEYVCDSRLTKTAMRALSYSSWLANYRSRDGFGWGGSNWFGKHMKRFGVALRVPNPDFVAEPGINIHTQEALCNGKRQPRYLYSMVAPLTVFIEREGRIEFSLLAP